MLGIRKFLTPRESAVWAGSLLIILLILAGWFSAAKKIFQFQHPRTPVTLELASQERFFDTTTSSFGEPYSSNALFSYSGFEVANGGVYIDGLFDVRKLDGSPIFSARQNYTIDGWSGVVHEINGSHTPPQHLLFPRFLYFKPDLDFRYIGHNKPILLRKVGKEIKSGKRVLHYTGLVTVDKSVEFAFALKDGQGMRVDAQIDVWVEPITGTIVDFRDAGTDTIYDLNTGADVGPWNTFVNSQTDNSSILATRRVEVERASLLVYFFIIPLAILVLLFATLTIFQRRLTNKEFPWEIDEKRWHRMSLPFWRIVPALVVTAISATGVYVTWQNELFRIDQKRNLETSAEEAVLRDNIEDTLRQDLAAIRSAVGLIAASENVTSDEWQLFAEKIELGRHISGMQALGFAQHVSRDDKKEFESAHLSEKGVWPAAERDFFVPIRFIAPKNPTNDYVVGFDFASEAVRFAAVTTALETGSPTMTGKIFLKQDQGAEAAPGFLILQAVYTGNPATIEERRASIMGYVYGAFRARDIVTASLSASSSGNFISIFDTASSSTISSENALYDLTESGSVITSTETIALFGRPWTFIHYENHHAARSSYALADLIAAGGGIVTIIIFLLVYTLSTSRHRALKFARDANRRISEDARKLQTLLETLPVGVYVMDAVTAEPTLLNRAGKEIVGRASVPNIPAEKYSDAYALVTADSKPYPTEKLPPFVCARSGKPAMADDMYHARADGHLVALSVRSVPVTDVDGKTSQVITVFTDVTAQRELENQRREFLSIASHQLRTPLTAIKWFTELLATGVAGKLKPKQAELVHQTADSAARMIRLVNDLLDVSRIENGKVEPQFAPTDISAIVRSILDETRPLLRENRLVVKTAIVKKAEVSTDGRYVRQVAVNLISNAIKYSKPRGKINVTLSVKSGVVEFRVTDYGIGIPEAQQPMIFRKFFRAENAAQGSVDGTGLGLYVCKSLVEKLGGKIWFETVENKGSTFAFTLPRRK